MVYWSELYTEIAEKIKANIEQVRWIDLWHEQVSYLTEELSFPTPAVFIGFNTREANDTGLLVQEVIRLKVCFVYYHSDDYNHSYNTEMIKRMQMYRRHQ